MLDQPKALTRTFVARGVRRVQREIRFAKATRQLLKTYRRFRPFTMIPEALYLENLRLALSVRGTPGIIIECGTWRGGMIAGIAEVLGPDREYLLFDSFEGLPAPRAIDGPAALQWQADTTSPYYYDNGRVEEAEVRKVMSLSRATNFSLIKGWFRDSLPGRSGKVALLRMDGDWYESTKCILDNLAPLVVPGGMIIADDYYAWDGCARAVNEFAASHALRIRESRAGVCYIQL
jgi:O-methyltransferase